MKPFIFAIRGAPGIGKTTLGNNLRSYFSNSSIIDIDLIRNTLNAEKFIYNDNEHYFKAVWLTAKLVEEFVKSKYSPIIIIDVFSDPILEYLFKILNCKNSIYLITLICDSNVLSNRMNNRKNGYINTKVAIHVQYKLINSVFKSDITIDTSNLLPKQVFQEVKNNLEKNE